MVIAIWVVAVAVNVFVLALGVRMLLRVLRRRRMQRAPSEQPPRAPEHRNPSRHREPARERQEDSVGNLP
jgi:flagellar biosynthesis/type III secretory pathway M-ring protein FliF/YscJ